MSQIWLLKRLREALDLEDDQAREALRRLVPTLSVGDLSAIAGQFVAHGYNFSSAGAGVYSIIQVLNPATSGRIIRLQDLIYGFGGACSIYVRHGDTALGAATGNEQWRDRRLPGVPVLEIRSHQGAAVGGSILLQWTANANYPVMPMDWVIPPGYGYTFAPSAQNIGLTMCFRWIEFDAGSEF